MKFAAVACALAIVAGALVFVFQPFSSSPPGSSASRTAYSFAFALDHHNFGRACSYLSDKQRGPDCPAGFTYNAGMSMMLAGIDLFAGMHVVPGSAKPGKNGAVVYEVTSPEIPPTVITVEQQKSSGLWRVVKIG